MNKVNDIHWIRMYDMLFDYMDTFYVLKSRISLYQETKNEYIYIDIHKFHWNDGQMNLV